MSDPSPDVAPRRVLHLIETAGIYGAERVILNLSREMQADGRYVPVIACIVQREDEPTDLMDAARNLGIESYCVKIANRNLPCDLVRAARWVRRMRIDAIHCHGYKPSVFAFVISAMTKVGILATCHLWFIDEGAPLKMRLMIALEKRLYRRFQFVVAVSDHIQRTLTQYRVPPHRTRVIKNGIVLRDYGMAPRSSLDPIIRILNVGRLTEQKSQTDLIAAAHLLIQRRLSVHIDIVGEGELRANLAQQIQHVGMTDHVKLLGFRDDIQSLLQRADIFVLPSLDEGMPISLLEAVACHVPVITTAVGDIPKLIVDGESGVIVEPRNPLGLADAIQQLAGNAALRRSLSEEALKRLQDTFSSKQMFAEYAEVYTNLFES